MTLSKLTLTQLAARYNEAAQQLERPTIKKFSDRESAIRRTSAIEAEVKPVAQKHQGRGRRAVHAGKKLYPIKDQNPRRVGTFGHASYQVILDQPGILYEDYKKAGGRNNDLNWDIERGRVEAKE